MKIQQQNVPLLVAVIAVMASPCAIAESWDVTQTTTVTDTATGITQNGVSANSIQAVNAINLNGTTGEIGTASQTFETPADHNITLIQQSSTTASDQAINRAYAHTITDLTQEVTLSGTPTIHLKQQATAQGNNTQAINQALITNDATAVISKLEQNVSFDATTFKMDQTSPAEENIQAGNLIQAGTVSATAGDITQNITVDMARVVQENTSKSIQAPNALVTLDSGTGGSIAQSFEGTFFGSTYALRQTTANNSVQALNFAGEAI
ncbi:hypothetical protein [Candidatus Thiothrix anitrata]|uniref:Uncharacterized protein n=1 Tax=Candidatus Thiothrix anitrata TaxID=2823902 RepID=A0ABX7X3T0_9GAMM|nr:hypothetical protein [Candidatus Thiothrix anitrata]QTR50529.1 hypothetical protein J8380_02870 [Candidatus Thiothrix anitrata]